MNGGLAASFALVVVTIREPSTVLKLAARPGMLVSIADRGRIAVEFQIEEFAKRFEADPSLIERELVLLPILPPRVDAADAVSLGIEPAISGPHVGTEFHVRGQDGPKVSESHCVTAARE